MSFPTVNSIGEFVSGAGNTDHTANFPAVVNAGELLLFFVGCDGTGDTPTITGVTGITLFWSGTHTQHGSCLYWLEADGSEGGGTFNVNVTSGEDVVAYCMAIGGWNSASPPEFTGPSVGSNINPDPPDISPSWGAEDNLFYALASWNNEDPTVSSPTNYNYAVNDDQTISNGVARAARQLNASSDNPDGFELEGAQEWAAFTVVIRPVGAGVAPKYIRQHVGLIGG